MPSSAYAPDKSRGGKDVEEKKNRKDGVSGGNKLTGHERDLHNLEKNRTLTHREK